MASRKSPAPALETPGILPLPDALLEHHKTTLSGPISEWAKQNRIPPVLLLTGTSGCGKRNVGYWLAQWILCERGPFATAPALDHSEPDHSEMDMFGGSLGIEPTASEPAPTEKRLTPCGECPSCLRATHSTWVDFSEVLAENSDGEATTSGGTLKVDQFRELKSKLGFGAHQGAYRIILIPNADRMTVQAANSMLKLLEEPPRGWIFFLTASDPTLVLPTILSRCQQLRLKPLSTETIEQLLEADLALAKDPKRRQVCARLAQGSWSRALSLARDEAWDQRQTIFGFVQDPGSQLNALVDWAALAPANFDLLIDQLEQVAGELIRFSIAEDPSCYAWINSDGAGALSAHAQAMTRKPGGIESARHFWTERAERLARARREALAPLNRKILVQDLLIPWLRA